MSREAMQRALEALEQYKGVVVTHYDPESFRRMEVDGGQAARDAIDALRAALAEPDSDYERGFVDGMNLQTKGSVDKAVNRMAEPEQEPVRLQCTTCGTVYADGVPPQVPEQKAWFTVEELNEFATKLKEKAWKA